MIRREASRSPGVLMKRAFAGALALAGSNVYADCSGQGQAVPISDEAVSIAEQVLSGVGVQLQPGSALAAEVGDALACVELPPITVTPPGTPPPNWMPPSYGGGGYGGGGGGGAGGGAGDGGQAPQAPYTLPRPPEANDEVSCDSTGEIRTIYARVNVVYARMRSGTLTSPLNGNPRPGVPFSVRYGNGQKESFIAGPYGSPTLTVASVIQGSCY